MNHSENTGAGHVSSPMSILLVWAALIVLTVVTVGATYIDLGGTMNLWVAMIIATAKAVLVALYFMHLRYETPFILIVFLGTLLFVALLVSISMMDAAQYSQEMIPGYAPGIEGP